MHHPDLGGMRVPKKDSPNGAWENDGFRGYADYMLGEQFQRGLETVIELGKTENVALMCAEAVYWRCHRRLVSDALVIRGIPVHHIFSMSKVEPHPLTEFAKVQDGKLFYPPAQGTLGF